MPFVDAEQRGLPSCAWVFHAITRTSLFPLWMLKKESQHFSARVRAGGVGEAAPHIAACPCVRCPVNSPQFGVDAVGGNEVRDGTGTSASNGPTLFAVFMRSWGEALNKLRGIPDVNRGVRVAMKDDDGPFRQ